MRAVDVIEKKKQGKELSREEISFFINGYVTGEIPDYQASAFLMACCFQNLTPRETADLTDVMMRSGDVIDFEKEIRGYTVDKHSTGGVGDKTTLVLGPLVAACGGVVAKMSGRGLGHTGGTLDKLEAVKGVTTSLERDRFIEIVNKIGVAVCGQTGNIVPADKKLYALRDVTATVEDTALIAASIMSKKLAISNKGLILDVKTGRGAFMKTLEDSIELGKRMVEIGTLMDRNVIAMVTEMNIPLGRAIGNTLEVHEAIDTLKGEGPEDLVYICVELGSRLLLLSSLAKDLEEARQKIRKAISDGSGLKKFEEMIVLQGGSLESLYHLQEAENRIDILSPCSGWVLSQDALMVGHAAMLLGAGRATKEDSIDPSVGIVIHKKVGDRVEKEDSLLTIHYNSDKNLSQVERMLFEAYEFSEKKVKEPKLIFAEIDRNGISCH